MIRHRELTQTASVVLAGGRSRRLDGTPKAGVIIDGVSLLERTLTATGLLARSVVVGPDPGWRRPRMVTVREDPPFAGPAAALQAGLSALAPDTERVLVFACDYVYPEVLVRLLLNGPRHADGSVVIDEWGNRQWLAGVYSRRLLVEALGEGDMRDRSVASALSNLSIEHVPAPPGMCADIDTHHDLRAYGAEPPHIAELQMTLGRGTEPDIDIGSTGVLKKW